MLALSPPKIAATRDLAPLFALVLASMLGAHPADDANDAAAAIHYLQHATAARALARELGPIDTDEADISLKQLNMVVDAPWRVQIRPQGPNYIPVLFFFPETKKDWRRVQIVRMRPP